MREWSQTSETLRAGPGRFTLSSVVREALEAPVIEVQSGGLLTGLKLGSEKFQRVRAGEGCLPGV